jgi:hypothetical protein
MYKTTMKRRYDVSSITSDAILHHRKKQENVGSKTLTKENLTFCEEHRREFLVCQLQHWRKKCKI